METKTELERKMKKCISETNRAERFFKTFDKYPDNTKEKTAAFYWSGRLTELKRNFKDMKLKYDNIK
jgi:hypothetical protein